MNLRLEISSPYRNEVGWEKRMRQDWNKFFPYKCAFGFTGNINKMWEEELNAMTAEESDLKNRLPDLIVVNKKGMIEKLHNRPTKLMGGETIDKDFLFIDFKHVDFGAAIMVIVNQLYLLSKWQNTITPSYHEYFNKDFEAVV